MRRSACLVVAMMLLVSSADRAQSQVPTPGPEHKKMLVWLGDWTFDEETRDSAGEPWYRVPWKCQVRSILGGFFTDFRCRATVKGTDVDSIEIEGVDPVRQTNVTSFFASDGSSGRVTSAKYVGNQEDVAYTSTTAAGKTFEARCTWKFGADSMSVDGTCDRLTDGKWVPFRRLTGTKAKGTVK